jgi:hypothetical protein
VLAKVYVAPDRTITSPGTGCPNGRGSDSQTDGSECSGPPSRLLTK